MTLRSKPKLSALIPLLNDPADTKKLATLVRKYGRAAVVDSAKKVDTTDKRGRPLRRNPYFERVSLAWWIEKYMEEHRARGSRHPYRDTITDLYEMEHDEKERRRPGHFAKFEKNIKKKWLQGRRELREMRELDARREEWLAKQRAANKRKARR